MKPAQSQRAVQRAGVLVATGLAYYATGRLGLEITPTHLGWTPVWAPAGVALAVILLTGPWVWPAVFSAGLLLHLFDGGAVLTAVAIAAGSTLEALVGAHVVMRFANAARSFERITDVMWYVVAAIAAPMIAATVGATALGLASEAEWTRYGTTWVTWWARDAASGLVVTPVILLWVYPPPMEWPRGKIVEAMAVGGLTVFAALVVFGGVLPPDLRHAPLDFLCVPFVGWAALRLSPRVAATGVLLVALVATWGTARGFGPFVDQPGTVSLLLLLAYVGVTAIGSLFFAASVRERRGLIRRLEDLSSADPLTGLANYRRLVARIEAEIVRSQRTERPFTLVLLDLDRLKLLNDQYGHVTGSRALCRVAEALRDTCRAVDTSARYGGDEFAVVLPETDRSAAEAAVDRIRKRLQADGESPPITASIGYAVYPRDGDTVESLIACADLEMYRLKPSRTSS